MSTPKFKYQTIQIQNRPSIAGGPSARGNAVGASVELLHKASVALNRYAVSYRVNQELKRMESQIEREMTNYETANRHCKNAGVLVIVGVQEWEHADFTGTRAQMFLSIHTGGAGCNAKSVYQKYYNTPNMVADAPRGWRRRNLYIWVTR